MFVLLFCWTEHVLNTKTTHHHHYRFLPYSRTLFTKHQQKKCVNYCSLSLISHPSTNLSSTKLVLNAKNGQYILLLLFPSTRLWMVNNWTKSISSEGPPQKYFVGMEIILKSKSNYFCVCVCVCVHLSGTFVACHNQLLWYFSVWMNSTCSF